MLRQAESAGTKSIVDRIYGINKIFCLSQRSQKTQRNEFIVYQETATNKIINPIKPILTLKALQAKFMPQRILAPMLRLTNRHRLPSVQTHSSRV